MKGPVALAILLASLVSIAQAGGVPESVDPVPRPAVGERSHVEPAAPGVEAAPVAPAERAAPVAPRIDTPPVDPGARLPSGASAAEHWDLAAHFTSGHRLYARFLITNTGPGDRTAVAFGHLLRPDGEAVEFRNGRRAGRWELSGDRRRIRIGSSVLELGGGMRRFEVDNDKREIEIRLEFPDDGHARSGPERAGGYRIDLLNLATPATGSVRLAGMSEAARLEGFAALTHTGFSGPEDELVLRRVDVATLAPGPRLFVSEITPPGGATWRWAVAGDDHGLESVPDLELAAKGGQRGNYPTPGVLELGSKHLTGSIALGETRLEVDPLDALPALLRMVYSFGGRPRHAWVDIRADVVLKSPTRDAVLRIGGSGTAALFFLDSFPPKEP